MATTKRVVRPNNGDVAPSSAASKLPAPSIAEAASLKSLAMDVLRTVGALVEEGPEGLVDVLVPEERQARLESDGFLRLAFDLETAAAHPDAQYLAIGSPLAGRIVALGQQLAVAARWYVNGLRWSRRQAISLDRWRVKLTNARFLPASGVEFAFACHHVLFNFRVAYVSDEKREEIRTVVVAADSLQSAPLLQQLWGGLSGHPGDTCYFPESLRPAGANWPAPVSLDVRPEFQLSDTDRLPDAGELAALYRRAGELLEEQIADTLGTYRRRAAWRLQMERQRINTFYDDTEAELRKRLARAESDDRRRSIEAKLEANRLDREHKLADIAARYRLRVVSTLLSAALITQPKVRTHVRIENRYASAELPVILNPLTGHLELPTCGSCHAATASLHLCANGHVVCDDCALPCAFCQREHCRDCGVGACAVCGRPICPTHQVRCPDCGKVTCLEDRGRCH